MFSARKIVISLFAVLFFSLLVSGAAFAQDVMGCVDPQKIMFQHPKFEEVQKQIRDVTNKKQEEAKALLKKRPTTKEGQIFQTKRQKLPTKRKAHGADLQDINLAIRRVANAKKITVVVDKEPSSTVERTSRTT